MRKERDKFYPLDEKLKQWAKEQGLYELTKKEKSKDKYRGAKPA